MKDSLTNSLSEPRIILFLALDSRSSSLETFVGHFTGLINFIYAPKGFMRMHERHSQNEAVKEILKDLDQVIKDLKKKEADSISGCTYSKDICSMIWD